MSLLFNMLSRLVVAFLPRSKHLLISWLQSPSAVIFGAQKNKVCHCFHFFPIYLPWSDRTGCHDLSFLNAEFKANFFTLLFHFHQEALWFFFTFFHKGSVICIYEVIDISSSNLESSWWFIQPDISHDVQYEKGHEWIASNVWRQERWKEEGQNLCAALWRDGIVSL